MPDSNDPKNDRVINTLEIPNVFDPKVAQELFDEAMAENGKKAALIAQKDAEIAELKKNFQEEVRQFGYYTLIFIVLFGFSSILNIAWWILPESEGQEISNTTEKTVASDKPDIYSFEGAKKGRALTVEEAVEYSVNFPAYTRREIIKSWDQEKIVCVDISLYSEYEPEFRFFKLPDDLYCRIAYHGLFSPKRFSEEIEAERKAEERRIKIQEILELESPKKEAPKPKPEPIEY